MTFLVPDESQRIAVYMLAGACAELVGSTFLSPFEACRIRLIANPQYADGLFPCLIRIKSTEGLEGLFRGLPAILAKQVPYTVVQLSVFETVANTAYSYLNHNGIPFHHPLFHLNKLLF
jgi:solute carrier family 25 phosphate transporter 3